MSQLRKLQFWHIGSLALTDQTELYNKIRIGPIYSYNICELDDKDYGKTLKVNEDGPFDKEIDSTSSYLSCKLPSRESLDPTLYMNLAADELTRWMISCMPYSTSSPHEEVPAFVLTLPNFDSQNIMIDE